MSASWQIDGSDLSDAAVTVTVEPGTLKSDHPMRVQDVKRLHNSPVRHQLGTEFPTYTWRFRFIGAAEDRHARLQAVKAALKTSTSFTLTAPDTGEVFFDGDERSVILTLNSLAVVYEEGLGATALDVVAVQLNPSEVAGGDVGFSRGQAQTINGVCQSIGENMLQGDALLRDELVPVSADLLFGESKLVNDGPGSSEQVFFGEAVLIDNGSGASQDYYISTKAFGDNAPLSAEITVTNT